MSKTTDFMSQQSDREIERLKSRLAKEYKQAEKELKRNWKQFAKQFEAEDKRKYKDYLKGLITHKDYVGWREGKILQDTTLQKQIENMSQHIMRADEQASDIVNGVRYGVYAENYNFARYEIEKGLHVDTSFTLFDQKTVERLAHDNPRLLPKVKADTIKGQKWSKRKINNAITQGVLQGKALPDIAKNLEQVVGMRWNSAVRNARTAITSAQNGGRLASYQDAREIGINLKKQWVATLDEITRESHQDLDGEVVEVDEEFSNGLMFPGDPNGEPEEVYNCRCTMIADLVDYPREDFQRYDQLNGKPIDYVTYNEWAQDKQVETPDTEKPTERTSSEPNQDLESYKDWEASDNMRANSQMTITPEQEQNIYRHGNSGYIGTANSFDINHALRYDNFNYLSDEDKHCVNLLQQTIRNNKMPEDVRCVRMVGATYMNNTFGLDTSILDDIIYSETSKAMKYEEILKGYKGMTITEKGFMSVSTNIEDNVFTGRPVQMELYTPKGTPCYVTHNFYESEVIFNTNQKYKVLDVFIKKGESRWDTNRVVIRVMMI